MQAHQATRSHLEGQAQVLAIGIHRLLLLLRHVAQHRAAAAAGGYEAGGLVEGLVQVLLQADVGVKEAAGLANLAVGKVSDDLGDELDDLQAKKIEQPCRMQGQGRMEWLRGEAGRGQVLDTGSCRLPQSCKLQCCTTA